MSNFTKIYIISTFLWIASCGPSTSTYPSYEDTIAKYSPDGQYRSSRLTDSNAYPDSAYCDCPRVWYSGHWVYYYRGRWIYWADDYWYYYPYFYVYYYDNYPYAYTGPGHSITKGHGHGGAVEHQGHQGRRKPAPPPKTADKQKTPNKIPKRD